LLCAALIAGCGGDDSEDAGDEARASGGCREVSPPAPRESDLSAPKQNVKPGEELIAVVRTSCGSFDISLDTRRAPKTVNSFAYLAREGFYDGLAFQRVVPGFVIQGGDPRGDGTGGPGYSVDEAPPGNLAYTRGIVAMAKTEVEPPGRSGSQFFVVIAPDAGLSPDYALVGRVTRGFSVVERIGRLGTPTEEPRQPVVIDRIAIERG
jgi:cyclophilin family peptidyl-prolyl cis-trans isomerase